MSSAFDDAPSLISDLKVAQGLYVAGRLGEARQVLEKILEADPRHHAALHQMGLVYAAAGDFANAEKQIKESIRLGDGSADYCTNYGNILQALNRLEDAQAQYMHALALNPNLPEAHYNQGLVLQKLGQHHDAVASFTQAILLRGGWFEPYLNRGNSLVVLSKQSEAMADYDQAIRLNPQHEVAHINKAILLFKLGRFSESIENFERGLRLNPNSPETCSNFAEMLARVGDHVAAARMHEQAYRIKPHENFALGLLIHQKMLVADWRKVGEAMLEHGVRLRRGEEVAEPFGFMGFAESEEDLLIAAKTYSRVRFPVRTAAPAPFRKHAKIRIGYLGGEFRAQATAFLLTGMLEAHDKKLFEVFLFDNGLDDGSEIRHRLVAASDEVVRISELTDVDAAHLIRTHEVDVLIDLNGFFGNARQGVLAHRPSPVQVSYLGCPGTMGTDYMDYLIADAVVLPRQSEIFYTEKIVRLPHCYQCNDNRRQISAKNFTRAEWGLPETGFVFCCFNNIYKILPTTFNLWVKILKQVEGSVLWLFESRPAAVENLRKEAQARGLDPSRIIFAKHAPLPEHLARHRLADLFLDTLPYNAHTTASDALWAGLPVLTLTGTTFPGRVATSLLQAVNMPELITSTPEQYEAMAIDLATHPEKLAALRAKLAQNRLTSPLFNTKLYTAHFEAALTAMYERSQAGLPPDHIEIKA